TAKGFIGFFDIDNLKKISKEELERCVKRSCTVIVCMHDETTKSEWCRLEWEVAEQNNVPALCIGDLQHCQKKDIIAQVLEHQVGGHMLKHQWVDYIDSRRRIAQDTVKSWLQGQIDEEIAAKKSGKTVTSLPTEIHRQSSASAVAVPPFNFVEEADGT
ncbi:unnamed protein product, partial [Polarella glacialis]